MENKEELINLVDRLSYSHVTEHMKQEGIKNIKNCKNIKTSDLLNKTYRYENFISDEFCEWIIYEAESFALENNGWTSKRHKNYPTTDLPVKSICSLCIPLINLAIRDILPLIAKHYNFNSYYLNIMDLFIVKYDFEGQKNLGFHKDGSIISFNILLNDDFEGGGTIINHPNPNGSVDRVLHKSKKGDLFIHSGKLLHSGNEITSGKRYIIVGFVQYCFHLLKDNFYKQINDTIETLNNFNTDD